MNETPYLWKWIIISNFAGQARYSNFTKMLEQSLVTLSAFMTMNWYDNDAED